MSFARPNRPVVGDKRVQRWIDRQEERGQEHPDVTKFLARQLSKDRGLSANVVNKYNDSEYPTGKYGSFGNVNVPPFGTVGSLMGEDLDEKYGRGTKADIAGMKGASLRRGDVYMGATAIETPATSTNTPYGGNTSGPASTRYDVTVLPRWMVKQQQQSENPAAAPVQQTDPTSTEPSVDLIKAREAYDRATQYQSQGGDSRGGSDLDLTASGSSLYQNLYDAGSAGVANYENRFIPALDARAKLTAEEIRYGTGSAIDALPDNLQLPTYDKMFPKVAAKKGLYKWLENRLA
jgi:hypothetical protein